MLFSKKLTLKSSLTEKEFDFVFSKIVSEESLGKLFKGFKAGNQFEIRIVPASTFERTSFYPIMNGVIQHDANGLLIRAKFGLPTFTVVFMAFTYLFMIFWFTGFFYTKGFNSETLNDYLGGFIAIFFSLQVAFYLVFYFKYKELKKYIIVLFEAEVVS
jgi:hypothetical protein